MVSFSNDHIYISLVNLPIPQVDISKFPPTNSANGAIRKRLSWHNGRSHDEAERLEQRCGGEMSGCTCVYGLMWARGRLRGRIRPRTRLRLWIRKDGRVRPLISSHRPTDYCKIQTSSSDGMLRKGLGCSARPRTFPPAFESVKIRVGTPAEYGWE